MRSIKTLWTIGTVFFAFSILVLWLISGPHPDLPSGFSDDEHAE